MSILKKIQIRFVLIHEPYLLKHITQALILFFQKEFKDDYNFMQDKWIVNLLIKRYCIRETTNPLQLTLKTIFNNELNFYIFKSFKL